MSTPDGAARFGGNSNPQRQESAGAQGSNVFTRKLGPLPLWAWMGVVLAIALAFSLWRKQTASKNSTANQSITPPGSSPDQTVAGSQIPQFVNLTNVQNAQSQTETTNVAPPAAPPPPPQHEEDHDHNGDRSPSPPPNPQFITVTVGKWPSGTGGSPAASQNSFGPGTAAWNSTLWGIATHYNVSGGYQRLAQLNGIANPNLIYPGQKIKVPVH